MPLLIHPDTGERVRATHEGAEILLEQGYTPAEPTEPLGGPAGIPQAERIIVDNLKATDWDSLGLDRLSAFVESGGRRYAEAVLEYERTHLERADVIAMVETRLDGLPEDDDPAVPAGVNLDATADDLVDTLTDADRVLAQAILDHEKANKDRVTVTRAAEARIAELEGTDG